MLDWFYILLIPPWVVLGWIVFDHLRASQRERWSSSFSLFSGGKLKLELQLL
jgi:hypothetical protein